MSVIPQPRPSRRDRVRAGARSGRTTAIAIEPRAPTGTLVVRLLFGAAWAIDAVMKWLPGFRHSFLSQLRDTAHGQPSWLHWWFHDWIVVQSHAPGLFVALTAITETLLALVLLLGVARRAGYLVGIGWSLLVWAVGEGFGGPYMSGSTDIGTGIVYALLFGALLVFAPPARRERLCLDRLLVARWSWWRFVAEPHADDRR
jgi:thiosulfate dehydrogenase [quinone] large subunit